MSVVETFLAAGPAAGARRDAIAGDASRRRYERLHRPDQPPAILMDGRAEPQEALDRFVRLARWLRDAGLAAPGILQLDADARLAVIEDLGPTSLADLLDAGPNEEAILGAVDVLATLDRMDPPDGLDALTPERGAEMLKPLDWHTDGAATRLAGPVRDAMARLCPPPDRLALRDFHAANVIWREDRVGSDRVGLLDFQDAILAPPGYDLVSLLRDARRPLDPATDRTARQRFQQETGQPDLGPALAMLGLQRNLRILGIFSRLAKRDGRSDYLRFVPITVGHLAADLAHPALAEVARVVHEVLPDLQDAAP